MATTEEGRTTLSLERPARPAPDRLIRQRGHALAVSLLGHGLALLALVYLLQRIAVPPPPPESSVSLVFAPPGAAAGHGGEPCSAGRDGAARQGAGAATARRSARGQGGAGRTGNPAAAGGTAGAVACSGGAEPRGDHSAGHEAHAGRASGPPARRGSTAPGGCACTTCHRACAGSRRRGRAVAAGTSRGGDGVGSSAGLSGCRSPSRPTGPGCAGGQRFRRGDACLGPRGAEQRLSKPRYRPQTTVERWRFVPATRGGAPVSAVAEVPVRFRLAD